MDARTYFEQQTWWQQEKSLWVKARLAEQRNSGQSPSYGMSDAMLIKITAQAGMEPEKIHVNEIRKVLIKLSEFNQKLYDTLLDKALKLADKNLGKLLMYYHPQFLTIEQYQNTMRNNQSKSPKEFMLWLSTCLDRSVNNNNKRIQEINARYCSLELFKSDFKSEHISLEALGQALENTHHPEVFSYIWKKWPRAINAHDTNQRFIKANNNWRVKLATRAIELNQASALEKIITSWPKHCNKPEGLIKCSLAQPDSISACLLIHHNFNIPENAHVLLEQHYKNSLEKITNSSAYKSEKKFANEGKTQLMRAGFLSTSLSILLSIEVVSTKYDYVMDKLKHSPAHQLHAFSILMLFLVGITSFYYSFVYTSKIITDIKSLENNYKQITTALTKKQVLNKTKANATFDFPYQEKPKQMPAQVKPWSEIDKRRFQLIIIEHGDLAQIQNSLDADQVDLLSLKLAAKNTKHPEVFMHIWHLCKQEQFMTEISEIDYQELITNVFYFPGNTKIYDLLEHNKTLLNEDPFLFCFDKIVGHFKEVKTRETHIDSRERRLSKFCHTYFFWCCLCIASTPAVKLFRNLNQRSLEPTDSLLSILGLSILSITWIMATMFRDPKEYSKVQKMRVEFTENTRQFETICINTINKLLELGFKPSHSTLEHVAENFHRGDFPEIVYQKYFEAADDRLVANNSQNTGFNQGLYGQAKQWIATNIYDDLTYNPSV